MFPDASSLDSLRFVGDHIGVDAYPDLNTTGEPPAYFAFIHFPPAGADGGVASPKIPAKSGLMIHVLLLRFTKTPYRATQTIWP
jgi:hypothetical protein